MQVQYRETPIKKDSSWRGKRGTWPLKKSQSVDSATKEKKTKSHEKLLETPRSERTTKRKIGDFFKFDSLRRGKKKKKKQTADGGYVTGMIIERERYLEKQLNPEG